MGIITAAMGNLPYFIRTSKLKSLQSLVFAAVLLGITFWPELYFGIFGAVFNEDHTVTERFVALGEVFRTKWQPTIFGFTQGSFQMTFGFSFFGALGFYSLYNFLKNFFDYRVHLIIRNKGIYLKDFGSLAWGQISSVRHIEHTTEAGDDTGSHTSFYLYVDYIKDGKSAREEVELTDMRYSLKKLKRQILECNTNEELKVDIEP